MTLYIISQGLPLIPSHQGQKGAPSHLADGGRGEGGATMNCHYQQGNADSKNIFKRTGALSNRRHIFHANRTMPC
jgi:hypothetical protein